MEGMQEGMLFLPWGASVAQSVKCLTLAQVVISRFVGSSPASGSVLTAQSLEPASDSVSLSAPPLLTLCLSLKNKETLKKKKGNVPHGGMSHPGQLFFITPSHT